MSALLAGFPVEVAGVTVNRLCGSGLEAVAHAARAIGAEAGEVYVAGGVESMTRAPLVMGKPERAYARGNREVFDSALGWRFVNPRMNSLGHTDALGSPPRTSPGSWASLVRSRTASPWRVTARRSQRASGLRKRSCRSGSTDRP
jgi:hypothetical protein